jgi:hypothetical protein
MGSGKTLRFLVYREVQLCLMRGRFQAAEKAGRTENQATRADRRRPSRGGIQLANLGQCLGVVSHIRRAARARHEQHIRANV